MPNVKLEGVHRVTSKGRDYYYAWRGKGAPRLMAVPGSPAFVQELAVALEARQPKAGKGTIDELVTLYRASDAWTTQIGDRTREAWGPWLDKIRAHFGSLRVSQFDRPQIRPYIRRWRDEFRATPRAADMALQALSRLLTFGQHEGLLSDNACAAIPKIYSANRSELIWREEDLEQLGRHASTELMFAARLASLTSLRKSDLLRLTWTHVSPNSIEISTGKSGQRKTTLIPVYSELRLLLDEIRAHHADMAERFKAQGRKDIVQPMTVLANSRWKPWGAGFGASWNAAKVAAGLEGLHFHDLRGTAATRFYKANLTTKEIAQILTWNEARVEALMDKYVKRDELLRDRIRRLDLNTTRT